MRTRAKIGAAVAAAAILAGTAGSAVASTGGGASPSTVTASTAAAGKGSGSGSGSGRTADQGQSPASIAQKYHVSVAGLIAALHDAKETMGRLGVGAQDPAVVAVIVKDLGLSTTSAQALLKDVTGSAAPGSPKIGAPDPDVRTAKALAQILKISDAQATTVLHELQQLGPSPKAGPGSAQFAAIAASLHLTTAQLNQALVQLKSALSQ